MAVRLATGYFGVHFSGGTPDLRLYVRNFSRQSQRVPWRVTEMATDGESTVFARGTVTAASSTMHQVTVSDVQGRTLQIEVQQPSPYIICTAACVGTFIADGAERILVFIQAGGFAAIQATTSEEAPQRPAVKVGRS